MKKKAKPSYDEWMAKVDKIAAKHGYTRRPTMMAWEEAAWREMYDQGLTPQKAWEKA